ncbi:LysM peptidoglycan-binding domain-containing protein [Catenulispora sp. NL8]|uniref:LysM peptidoglycan-binding domain-containing protein n=1 Tax=Catenulispora pinistramenti TaxID=2705254 RepID=A0ABS5KGP3_9ACTN|nr:BTAD domain-containing putative transcriptional regulator [Catenulispora pinistramenti]MBS2545363.1 LysM peptidoglycan-binding domain-containing protein [Catenulispora pinistramenti]
MSLLGRLARAVAALAVTVGISAGVPWALLTYIGSPIPKRVPTTATVSNWLSTRVDIHVFLAIVVYLLWLVWVVFVVQIAVQIPGVIADLLRVVRHREPLRRDMAGGPGGTLVRGLIAAFTIALITPRSVAPQAVAKAAVDFHVGTVRPVSVAPAVPGAREEAKPSEAVVTETTEAQNAYTVVHGDTLWDIAEHHLGKANRWLEIFDLNRGRQQSDGRALTDPKVIVPGWVLELPDTEATPAAVASNTAYAQALSSSAHTSIAAPHSITVPAPPPLTLQPQAAQHAPATDRAVVVRTQHHVAPRDRTGIELPGGGYVGIELASGVAAALAFVRLRNRSLDRFRDIAQACGVDAPPLEPREAVAVLERDHYLTLCAPGRGYFQDEQDFVTDPYVDDELLPADGIEMTAAGEPALTEVPDDSHDRSPHAPSLSSLMKSLDAATDVCIGTRGNTAISLDTAAPGGLGLAGDKALEVARALLVSALAAGGAGETRQTAEVRLTGDLLQRLLGPSTVLPETPRLVVAKNPEDLLATLSIEMNARQQIVAEYGYNDADEVRRYAHEQPFVPLVVLADEATSGMAGLEALAAASRTVDIRVVGLGSWNAATTLYANDAAANVTGAGSAELAGLRAFTLSADEACELLRAILPPEPTTSEPFTDAEAAASLAPRTLTKEEEIWGPTTPPRPERAACRVQAPPGTLVLNLMGPFSAAIDGRDVSKTIRVGSRTFLLYLSLHPRGVARANMAETLWPNVEQKLRTTSFDSALSIARKQLREAAGATADFITGERGSGIVRLNPAAVTTDFAYFDSLIAKAATAHQDEDKTGLMEAACALYRGPIDESIKADWLLEHREGRLRAYRDAAGDLARIYSHDDPDRCLATLNALLEQDLLNEDLYRRIMRAQASLGRRDAVRRTLNLLDVRYEAAGFEVDPSTYTLADQLTRRPPSR